MPWLGEMGDHAPLGAAAWKGTNKWNVSPQAESDGDPTLWSP